MPDGPVPDQATLEESACNLAMRQILNAAKCQLSMGQLGNMPEILALLQKMGKPRPKLSKLLRDRSDTFTLIEQKASGDLIITLSNRAMALGRAEQVNSLKHALDSSAAEALQEANIQRDRKQAQEERRLAEVKSESSPAGSPVNRRWGNDGGQQYEDEVRTLVEMGFDRSNALKALRANDGDIAEAMDMLSTMPSAATPPTAAAASSSSRSAPQRTAAVDNGDDADEGDGDDENEEDALAQAIAASQREDQERKKRQDLDEEALEAALAQSIGGEASPYTPDEQAFFDQMSKQEQVYDMDEEEEQLTKILELSKLEEEAQRDERIRMEEREEEEYERAIAESQRMYELFHNRGAEDCDDIEALFASMESTSASAGSSSAGDASGFTAEDEKLLEALQLKYSEMDDYEDDDDEVVLYGQAPTSSDGQAPASSVQGGAASSSSSANANAGSADAPLAKTGGGALVGTQEAGNFEDASTAFFADEEEDAHITTDDSRGFGKWFGKSAAIAAPSSQQEPAPASSSSGSGTGGVSSQRSLRDWALERMDALGVELEKEVLWSAINEMGEDCLGNEEVVKMYLGFDDEDQLPPSIPKFLAELRQQKRLMQFSGQ